MTRLIVFAPNWLGDAVMALPALADVQRAQPAAAIHVAARASIAPLYSLVTGIEQVVVLDGAADAAAALRGHGYDAALLLTNSFKTALLARRAGIPQRWGYRADFRGPLLTRAVMRPVAWWVPSDTVTVRSARAPRAVSAARTRRREPSRVAVISAVAPRRSENVWRSWPSGSSITA